MDLLPVEIAWKKGVDDIVQTMKEKRERIRLLAREQRHKSMRLNVIFPVLQHLESQQFVRETVQVSPAKSSSLLPELFKGE